ncbi:MAG TPA: hypothetical protein VFZ86_07140, partial [Thermoleophilia bacterium]|nr:hypothetical protein [Thermoleophilia bacterium]
MREVVTGRVNRRFAALALVVVAAVCVLALAAPAFGSSPEPVAASSASPSPEPVAPALSAALSSASVVFGSTVTVSGTLEPAAEGQEVVVTFGGADAGTAVTDATGAYSFAFMPRRGGDVVVSLATDPAVAAAPLALAVKPKVTVSHGTLVPFLPSRFVVKVAPTAYDGVIVLKVVHRRALVGTYRARVKDGRAVFKAPLRGVDGFTLTYVVPAAGGLTGRTV